MKASFDCIPCIIRQTVEAARLGSPDQKMQREIINKTLKYLQNADFDVSPPELGKHIYQMISESLGGIDPYHEMKHRLNSFILKHYNELKRFVYFSDDPVHLAAKLSIVGNQFHFDEGEPAVQLQEMLSEVNKLKFAVDDYSQFLEDLLKSRHILFLADNAGEIVFDKLFIEVLKRFYPERGHKFIVVVRGAPIINDATRADAEMIDLDEVATVIDNGDNAPATVLHHVSQEMRDYYHKADLIISKGQGNFESLEQENKRIYFMFRIKCPVISKELEAPEGSLVLIRSQKDILINLACKSEVMI